MRYVVVIYENPKSLESRKDPEHDPYIAAWRLYYKSLVEAGAYVTGAPLKDAATATTVRLKDGRRQVQDGPFAEAKEQLGGFMILELPSLDRALEWAARCPAAAAGAVEVRPMDVGTHDTIVNP